MQRPIVITGFMGSGKSKVARELSRHLNLTMIDLDDAITAREGKSPAQLIVENGEPYFRSIESNVLRELLQTSAASIIRWAAAPGSKRRTAGRSMSFGCTSVWLDAPFDVCWARIETSNEDRPLGRNRDQALALYERRRPVYSLAAIHIQVPADNLEEWISTLKRELKTIKRVFPAKAQRRKVKTFGCQKVRTLRLCGVTSLSKPRTCTSKQTASASKNPNLQSGNAYSRSDPASVQQHAEAVRNSRG